MLLSIKTFISSVNYSWLNFKLQTQIIFATTILVVTLAFSVASWSTNMPQNSSSVLNSRLSTNSNAFLSENLLALLQENKSKDILPFFERFYRNSPSVRYLLFLDKDGLEYGIPYTSQEILTMFEKRLPVQYLNKQNSTAWETNDFEGIKVQANILFEESFQGLLLVGHNSNFMLLNNILITNEIIFSIVLIFLLLTLLGGVLVKLAIIKPVSEVTKGLNDITGGNFSKRINLRFSGELGELITSFNELGRRLQLYEEKNREQVIVEKLKFESLITTITDGALLLDTNLRIVLVNTTAIKLLGWKTKTRLIGTPVWNHLPITLQKKLFVTLQDILFDAQSAIFAGRIENEVTQIPQRSLRIILNVIYDTVENNRIPIGIGITVQDKTKEFELNKTQNRFMSNISHELRTPLFNIQSFIETIQEYDYTLSNRQKRYFLDIVSKETNRLTRLVNDILAISKLESLKKTPLGIMNIAETINQTTANYQIIARDKGLYLHSESFNSTLNIEGNKDLLFQVFINLVGNSLKFTYKQGEILIRAYSMSNQRIRIEVLDTGVGILYDYQQYIFQRFYRLENDVHTLKGAGLGLSIVETILAEHNTEINVVSRYGVGSIFWFDLLKP